MVQQLDVAAGTQLPGGDDPVDDVEPRRPWWSIT